MHIRYLTHAFFAKKSGQFLDKSGKRAYNDRTSQYFGNIQENKFQRWTNREPGASPGRSRHCVGEQAAYMSLRHDTREGAASYEPKSGDLLILSFEILTDDEKALPFGATDLSTRVIRPRGCSA